MSVTIKRPKKDSPPIRTQRGLFVAWGRADGNFLHVSGQCTATGLSDPPEPIEGKAHYFLDSQTGSFYRWIIVFRLPEDRDGAYRLTVTGYAKPTGSTKPGTLAPQTTVWRDFTTSSARTTRQTLDGGLTILWPDPDEDITDYADDFVPYGNTDEPLDTVMLVDNTNENNSPTPLYIYDDYSDLQFWAAQYPTLVDQNYTLNVWDVSGDFATAANLTID
jgi:hypothetical protein